MKGMTSSGEMEHQQQTEEYNGFGQTHANRIIISNIRGQPEDLESVIQQFGHVHRVEKINSREPQAILVTYESAEHAQQAINDLNNFEFEGGLLKVEAAVEQRKSKPGGRRAGYGAGGPMGGGPGGGGAGGGRQTDFPLRILVQSDMVGAIIGRQGSTIRQITQQSRARVDVHRKDNVGSLEKAITIYGNPDNCTNACKRILEVMRAESESNNKGEITLKILAHNNLIGRIIGKSGNTIKKIMNETETKITVSSINDINSFNLERIITVKGKLVEHMSKAESLISAKLRQSYENDLQAMAPQSMMFPGLHPMAMMQTSGIGFGGRGNTYQGGLYGSTYPHVYQPAPLPSHAPDFQETTYLYIPNAAVGAIIGTKGSHIRNMIRFSGATVKIASLPNQEKEGQPQQQSGQPAAGSEREQPAERKVTITGSPESQWKAQYIIFEKMREEGFTTGTDDVRLTVEILVPSHQVGRIIGKGGNNVRELQRITGSIIKFPEQGSNPTPASTDDETTVHIIGPFFSVQSAQRRIRAMANPTSGMTFAGGNIRETRRGQQQQQSSGQDGGSAAAVTGGGQQSSQQ